MAADRFDRILDIARGAAAAGPGERESREACRIPYAGTVAMITVTPSGDKTPPSLVACRDISIGGIRVRSTRELPVGGRGGVLIMKSDGEPVVLGARIVHVHRVGPHSYECGIEFETQPSVVSMFDFEDSAGNMPAIGPARAA